MGPLTSPAARREYVSQDRSMLPLGASPMQSPATRAAMIPSIFKDSPEMENKLSVSPRRNNNDFSKILALHNLSQLDAKQAKEPEYKPQSINNQDQSSDFKREDSFQLNLGCEDLDEESRKLDDHPIEISIIDGSSKAGTKSKANLDNLSANEDALSISNSRGQVNAPTLTRRRSRSVEETKEDSRKSAAKLHAACKKEVKNQI